MTTKALLQRVEALERANQPAGAIVVCWCARAAGRRNVEDHEPGCPVLSYGPNDTVLIVRYEDDD